MRPGAKYLLVALAAPWLATEAGHALEGLPLLLYKPDIDPHAFLPISYQCPPSKDGTVEFTKMSAAGGRIKVRVRFEGNAATHASVERAWREKPFEAWYEFTNPKQKPESESERNVLEAILGDAAGVRMAICFGAPGIKEKYDKILEHNRGHLRPPQPG